MFDIVKGKGRFVQMYEEAKGGRKGKTAVAEYDTWLAVNYKLEFCCDMKRDELHSLGISLVTGELRGDFHAALSQLSLSPRLPANTFVRRPLWPMQKAFAALEAHVEAEVRKLSHEWAKGAHERMNDEAARIDQYYGELLQTIEAEKKPEAEAQYAARKREIVWQYRPRIEAKAVNAGLFHLGGGTLASH